MAKRFVSVEERGEFFELLCSGLSLDAAAAGSGVSSTAGRALRGGEPRGLWI